LWNNPQPLPSFRLHTGAVMPACGLGTWQSPKGQVNLAVKAALECGYRHIDCAWIYGNEAEVGQALKETSVPRQEIFITSKLWNTAHAGADVEPACRDSLGKLGLDYLDLYLIHWPVSIKPGAAMPPGKDAFAGVSLEETWKAMEALVEKGLVKAIGVSNFSEKRIRQVLACAKIKPAVVQNEGHPYLQQASLKTFCGQQGIIVTSYSPLGAPERPALVKDESDPVLLEDAELLSIAASVRRSAPDVLIRWAVQRGTVVIPKSVTPARIASNLLAAMEPLPQSAIERLEKMEKNIRFVKGAFWFPEGHNNLIKSLDDLWNNP